MKALDIITLALLIASGVNWGLVGLFDFDLVSAILGEGAAESAPSSALSRGVYVLVAASALWQVRVLAQLASSGRGAIPAR